MKDGWKTTDSSNYPSKDSPSVTSSAPDQNRATIPTTTTTSTSLYPNKYNPPVVEVACSYIAKWVLLKLVKTTNIEWVYNILV